MAATVNDATVNDSADVRDTAEAERPGVVVGVDGSRTALNAVRWAAAEARLRGSSLTILHAAPYTADHSRPMMRRARDILARAFTVARRTQSELHITTRRTEDTPVNSLLDAAEHAELLVLGMSGGERFPEALVHSVALDVCNRVNCPVVVVRGDSTRKSGDVIVGVDTPGADAAAIEAAFADAQRHRGQVLVLHAMHDGGPFHDHTTAHEQSARDAALRRLSDELTPWTSRYPDVPMRIEVVHEHPVAALLSASIPARLVVLGTHTRGLAARALFGSTSRDVLRYCSVPVMVVHPGLTRPTEMAASTSTSSA